MIGRQIGANHVYYTGQPCPAKLGLEKNVTVNQLAEFAGFNFVETDGKVQG
ncbi:hypothetical protein [Flavitalea sp.]|nr:hypothetical protein [Flavitalea sp.]